MQHDDPPTPHPALADFLWLAQSAQSGNIQAARMMTERLAAFIEALKQEERDANQG